MSWLRVDDGALTHPQVMHLRSLDDPVATAEAVVGFVMLSASWSGQHLTDCFIPRSLGPLASPDHWRVLSAAAVTVGMLSEPMVGPDGQPGWMLNIGAGLFHLMSKEEVERNREHRKASRTQDVKIAVLLRDGDQCRYCGKTTEEHDRKSARGRQFDHPDPDVHDVLVVACRGCNGRKGRRTPEQAGMELLPPPTSPFYQPFTLAWLTKHGAFARPDGPSSDPAAPSPATEPSARPVSDPQPTRRALADPQHPGREGPGLDGTGSGREGTGRAGSVGPAPQTRDGPRRRRGSRGRRGRPPSPA